MQKEADQVRHDYGDRWGYWLGDWSSQTSSVALDLAGVGRLYSRSVAINRQALYWNLPWHRVWQDKSYELLKSQVQTAGLYALGRFIDDWLLYPDDEERP